MSSIEIRDATPDDRAFIDSLSPRLAGVPHPPWHEGAAMQGFQDRFMKATFAAVEDGARTLIACAPDGRQAALTQPPALPCDSREADAGRPGRAASTFYTGETSRHYRGVVLGP